MPEPKEPKKTEEEDEAATAEECELTDQELDTVSGAAPGEEEDD
jgi:hypothetical protein